LPRLGGIELHVHDLAQRQRAAGHDVTVVTTTVGPDPAPSAGGGQVIRLGGFGEDGDVIRYRRSGLGRQLAGAGEFDIVHVHASSFSPLAFLAAHSAARQGVPTVATVHSLWARATPLFHIADHVTDWGDWPVAWTAVSSPAAIQLRRLLAGRAEVTILPNGVDPEYWQAAPVATDPEELRLAVVGRLAPRKRPLHMARILYAVRSQLPETTRIRVDIVGDGPERARLERYLRRHAMTDWVHLHGRLTRAEIRDTFARSHLFVSPAVLESFGIAALEARCAGLPILARSGTGLQDFVVHDQEGWLADSDQAIVDRIVALAREPERVAEVRAHNRRVPPRITWPAVLETCGDVYRAATLRQSSRSHDRGPDMVGSQTVRDGQALEDDPGARSGPPAGTIHALSGEQTREGRALLSDRAVSGR
jgi:glycosyltransferase involved in cell wall biosynthesis